MTERARRIVDRILVTAALASAISATGCAMKLPSERGGGADSGLPGPDGGGQFGTEVVRATIGSGQGQLGVDSTTEAFQAGPMSFAVAPTGEIYVLDQLNARINAYSDGQWVRSVAVGRTTFEDMDLMSTGGFVLLDDGGEGKSVVVLDSAGRKLNEIALVGRNIPDSAAITGVQYRGDGVWVETNDGPLQVSVKVANPDGTPATPRIVVRGSFTSAGSRMMEASILGDITANVRVSDPDKLTWQDYPVYYESVIWALLGVCDDARGNIYLGTLVQTRGGSAPGSAELTVLSPSGAVLKRIPMFLQTRPQEIKRSLRVTSDGVAYQLAIDDQAVTIRRYP